MPQRTPAIPPPPAGHPPLDEPGFGFSIQYSVDRGDTWQHGRSVAGWVYEDRAAMAGQKAAVRAMVRGDGFEGVIYLRIIWDEV